MGGVITEYNTILKLVKSSGVSVGELILIAIGENTMFGGTNTASDHIDFVGRGKIEVI